MCPTSAVALSSHTGSRRFRNCMLYYRLYSCYATGSYGVAWRVPLRDAMAVRVSCRILDLHGNRLSGSIPPTPRMPLLQSVTLWNAMLWAMMLLVACQVFASPECCCDCQGCIVMTLVMML
jgi:hypothetical protein